MSIKANRMFKAIPFVTQRCFSPSQLQVGGPDNTREKWLPTNPFNLYCLTNLLNVGIESVVQGSRLWWTSSARLGGGWSTTRRPSSTGWRRSGASPGYGTFASAGTYTTIPYYTIQYRTIPYYTIQYRTIP